MSVERHTHVDLAAWIERYFNDDGPVRLEAFQRDMLDRIASGERVVIATPRNPDAAATLALARLADAGAIVVEGSLYQAERVWANARAYVQATAVEPD